MYLSESAQYVDILAERQSFFKKKILLVSVGLIILQKGLSDLLLVCCAAQYAGFLQR